MRKLNHVFLAKSAPGQNVDHENSDRANQQGLRRLRTAGGFYRAGKEERTAGSSARFSRQADAGIQEAPFFG